MEDVLLPLYPPEWWFDAVPSRALVTPPRLDSWQDAQFALVPEDEPLGSSPVDGATMDLWRARHCHALTIAHGLQQLPAAHAFHRASGGRGRDGRWLLWIVGAREPLEGELARQGLMVEVVSRLCPCKQGWELVLIGPEMRTWEMVAPDGGLMRARTGALHALYDGSDEKPDAAVLFNSGVGTLLWPLVDQWLPTVSRLLEMEVPILCTCFNVREVAGERAIFEEIFGATALTEAQRNPFGHPTPLAALAANKHSTVEAALLVRQYVASNVAWEAAVAVREAAIAMKSATQAKSSAPSAAAAAVDGPSPQDDAIAIAVDSLSSRHKQERTPHPVSNRWLKWLRGPVRNEGGLVERARSMMRRFTTVLAPSHMEPWIRELDAEIIDAGAVAHNAMLIGEAADVPVLALHARSCGAEAILRKAYRIWAPQATTRLLCEPEEAATATNGELSYTGKATADRAAAACITALRRIKAAIGDIEPSKAQRLQ